ncbi:MAG: hypothetical protein GXN92_00420 [Candidatus Micrarchaeota archaeon]|nr:hypothetical protein [Candidatus Micrarchaeota archaeon]
MNLLIRQLLHHKLRTALAFASVLIATLFLVSVIGISNIIQERFVESLNKLSPSLFMVLPFKSSNVLMLEREAKTALVLQMFSKSDLQRISTLPSVKEAYPLIQLTLPVNEYQFSVTGIPAKGAPSVILGSVDLAQGRLYKKKDEVVLGALVAEELDVRPGDNININGKRVKVVGILERVGQSLINADNSIFADYELLREMVDIKSVPAIIGIARNTTQATQDILNYLDLKYHGDWYSVISGESISEQLRAMTDIVKWFFWFIAAVTVIVSLVVIWNAIYTNVLDNYKNIATLKVLGMTKKQVIALYVGQGLVLVGAALLISLPLALWLLSWEQLLGIYLLMVLGGILASYLPAKRASEIPPAEALRYG